jgi:mannose-1-phosphate guanylyltransferase
MPELFEQLSQVEASLGKPEYATVLSRVWPQVTQQTIDYGVMEHASDVLVIPTDIGWTDVGSWGSLFELLPADQEGNIFIGPCLEIDTHNTLVFGDKRLVATIGVQDMVIVDTEDALLVCPKSRGQEVREIVEKLKENKQSKWL